MEYIHECIKQHTKVALLLASIENNTLADFYAFNITEHAGYANLPAKPIYTKEDLAKALGDRKMVIYNKIRFDNYTKSVDSCYYWSQICASCVHLYDIYSEVEEIEEIKKIDKDKTEKNNNPNSRICGVEGCSNEADFYIDFDGSENFISMKSHCSPNSPKYIITSDNGYWSNDIGWCCEYKDATKFNCFDEQGSIAEIKLPIGENVRWTWADDNKEWLSFDENVFEKNRHTNSHHMNNTNNTNNLKKVILILYNAGEIVTEYFDDIESAKATMKEEYEETLRAFETCDHGIDGNIAWVSDGLEHYAWKIEENPT